MVINVSNVAKLDTKLLHHLLYKLYAVLKRASASYSEHHRNLSELRLIGNVLEVILGINVFIRIESKVNYESLTLDVDLSALSSTLIEGLTVPAGTSLNSLIGEKSVLNQRVVILKSFGRLDKSGGEGASVTDVNYSTVYDHRTVTVAVTGCGEDYGTLDNLLDRLFDYGLLDYFLDGLFNYGLLDYFLDGLFDYGLLDYFLDGLFDYRLLDYFLDGLFDYRLLDYFLDGLFNYGLLDYFLYNLNSRFFSDLDYGLLDYLGNDLDNGLGDNLYDGLLNYLYDRLGLLCLLQGEGYRSILLDRLGSEGGGNTDINNGRRLNGLLNHGRGSRCRRGRYNYLGLYTSGEGSLGYRYLIVLGCGYLIQNGGRRGLLNVRTLRNYGSLCNDINAAYGCHGACRLSGRHCRYCSSSDLGCRSSRCGCRLNGSGCYGLLNVGLHLIRIEFRSHICPFIIGLDYYGNTVLIKTLGNLSNCYVGSA